MFLVKYFPLNYQNLLTKPRVACFSIFSLFAFVPVEDEKFFL